MEDYERSEAVDCAEETGRFQHQAAQQEKLTARESAALAGIRGAIDPLWSEEVVLERFKKLVGGVLVPDVDHSLREHVHEDEGATGRQDRREDGKYPRRGCRAIGGHARGRPDRWHGRLYGAAPAGSGVRIGQTATSKRLHLLLVVGVRAQALAPILRSSHDGRTTPITLWMNNTSDTASRFLATFASSMSLDSTSADRVRSPRQNRCAFI